ncbi:NAD(P)/FAD-dependent oxidoreductase [Jannaschia donghaensis]|uniref:Hydrogen cyanide synthase subunit HcnC n=1 Tax=Jannaschia donghaensis TaxID=420998 RepID=A0A0M6YDY7_9RHOB|nr:FAD-dependent oxidoreductase [Jannaschia donghaensis]CTQ48561.1 Hydrogen cyanide synthase subunit HcnC precursor [Jannaschia donghaensis]
MIHDVIVIGAGMAGASTAFELSSEASVLLLEAETQPGYHSTGRSAALFTRNYGSPLVRRINALSEPFFRDPPAGFIEGPLLHRRGAVAVASPGSEDRLDALLTAGTTDDPVGEISCADALAMIPFLRPERVARAVTEPGVTDIDVASLLQAYLRGFRARGGLIATSARITALARVGGVWAVTAGGVTHRAPTVVNAAGAWADAVGAMAGAAPIGLVAKRRTAIVIDAPTGVDVAALPCVDFVATDAYIKPEAGKLMASPGDATPDVAQDVRPDEMDIAVLADWIGRETTIEVRRISHSWAGLRSFVPDEGPVVGRAPEIDGFVWNAGQGGYGIMMAPTLARAAAAACFDRGLPDDMAAAGLRFEDLSSDRMRR